MSGDEELGWSSNRNLNDRAVPARMIKVDTGVQYILNLVELLHHAAEPPDTNKLLGSVPNGGTAFFDTPYQIPNIEVGSSGHDVASQ